MTLALGLSLDAAAQEPPAEPTPAEAPPGSIRFGAGSKGGGFAKTGEAIATSLEATDASSPVHVVYTGGSCDNVRKLANGELDAALVQYDVAAEAFAAAAAAQAVGSEGEVDAEGKSGWMCELSAAELAGVELELVAAIDDSAVHVIVRRPRPPRRPKRARPARSRRARRRARGG